MLAAVNATIAGTQWPCATLGKTLLLPSALVPNTGNNVLKFLVLAQILWAKPDCKIREPGYDGGLTLPRYVWHMSTAAESEAANKALKHPWLGTIAVGLLPHVIGVLTHQYRFSPRDWTAHLVQATLPIALESKAIGLPLYAGGYMATRCWSSP